MSRTFRGPWGRQTVVSSICPLDAVFWGDGPVWRQRRTSRRPRSRRQRGQEGGEDRCKYKDEVVVEAPVGPLLFETLSAVRSCRPVIDGAEALDEKTLGASSQAAQRLVWAMEMHPVALPVQLVGCRAAADEISDASASIIYA